MDNLVFRRYGYVADPWLSARRNAINQLAIMPEWLYFSRPSNIAFHNLCTVASIPANVRCLLGLGLNFCIRPRFTDGSATVDTARFQRDSYTRFMFAGDDRPMPVLFLRTTWCPSPSMITSEFRVRISKFCMGVATLFHTPRRCPSNLLPTQNKALITLAQDTDLIVFKTDKNLGPAIVERSVYIRRALDDHLLDITTYRRLTETQATQRTTAIRKILRNFASRHFAPKSDARKFLDRSLAAVTDDFSYFYILAKVHKNPWKTRPIVSVSGSLLHGLGKWVDRNLQLLISELPFALKSSDELHHQLVNECALPSTARFFTMDAVSMYTNIDTKHALKVITNYLSSPDGLIDCNKHLINSAALMEGLKIVMEHNVFRFGDTYWVQLSGTAMGTPPAPAYATLYFYVHELSFTITHLPNLRFYRRFIDDGIGIWIPCDDPVDDAIRWSEFQSDVNSFGKLTWEFSQRTTSVDFLDLTITIKDNGRISLCLYEKAMNLYLYLPPHSAHPPGVLKGLITGRVRKIWQVTSELEDRHRLLRLLFTRLCARGYDSNWLRPLFIDALQRVASKSMTPPVPTIVLVKDADPLFLHVKYHPCDPPSSALQQIFRNTVLSPPNEPPLPTLQNTVSGRPNRHRFGVSRMTVAYHRPRNLGNLLSPRKLKQHIDAPVSAFL